MNLKLKLKTHFYSAIKTKLG